MQRWREWRKAGSWWVDEEEMGEGVGEWEERGR